MSIGTQRITHATSGATLADVLERTLDQGLVIAGDIKIKLVEIELLTIQIRLVVCSVDKAIEMGMDWWKSNPNLTSQAREALPAAAPSPVGDRQRRQDRIADLEAELARLRAE